MNRIETEEFLYKKAETIWSILQISFVTIITIALNIAQRSFCVFVFLFALLLLSTAPLYNNSYFLSIQYLFS